MTDHSSFDLPPGAVVVVGGAGSTAGRAVAELLASRGARIVATDREGKRLEWTAGHSDIVAAPIERSENGTVVGALRIARHRFGRLDAVVLDLDLGASNDAVDGWREVRKGILDAFHDVRSALPELRNSGDQASLVLTSTSLAGRQPHAGSAVVAEYALSNLVRCFAVEAGVDGVRVNAVWPGTMRDGDRSEGGLTWAEGTAEVIAFLCSPSSSYVHGALIPSGLSPDRP